jgi:hypothetical protein
MNEFDDLLNEMLGANAPGKPTVDDDETWLLSVADNILQRRAEPNSAPLTPTDQAIYCFWVIDYAVRNSGTLEPMRELYPKAVADLDTFVRAHALPTFTAWLTSSADEDAFCAAYHDTFPSICAELRAHVALMAKRD